MLLLSVTGVLLMLQGNFYRKKKLRITDTSNIKKIVYDSKIILFKKH